MAQSGGQSQPNKATGISDTNDGGEIVYYTDPLCCWSWAMEPHLQQFKQDLGPGVTIQYKMGGLLPSWTLFHDANNSIRKPVQMGPEWLHAKHLSGAAIDDRLWIFDPPASSFPACIAVKAAELQGQHMGEAYLTLTWQAAMTKLKNVSKMAILLDLARELAAMESGFDVDLFRQDLGGRGKEAFKANWQEVKYLGITRFPTLIFRRPNRSPVLLAGYRTAAELQEHWTNGGN